MLLTLVPKDEVARRHAEARKELEARAPKVSQQPRNLPPVLALGNIEYHVFRGRPFGIAPVPYQEGTKLASLWIEAGELGNVLTGSTVVRYREIIDELATLLWELTRTVGPFKRLLRRLDLLRNPYRQATEREILELVGKFHARRFTTTIGRPNLPARLRRRIS
jgi:hypothetical protein